jgi:putative phosphoribosyl transferase
MLLSKERFRDRIDAGERLAEELLHYANQDDVIVLGLPRGGVPIAYRVAQILNVELDIFIVRKLGLPGYEEFAMGAIASGGILILNDEVIRELHISDEVIRAVARREELELYRREKAYRGDRRPLDVGGKIVILVDDGLATGSSMRAAVLAIKKKLPARVVVAVPVAAKSTCEEFQQEVDETICAITPEPFFSVGLWYDYFPQTTDEEVRALLQESSNRKAA